MTLPLEVQNYMDNYQSALEKEMVYIERKNWALEEKVFIRDKTHKRQYLITNRNMSKLKIFADMAIDFRTNNRVQKFFDLLVRFLEIYIERYEQCTKLYDWTIYEETFNHLSDDEIDTLIGAETEFQSEVLSNVTKVRLEMKKLNLDETVNSMYIPIHGDKSIPLLMRNKVEELYPSIQEYMTNKYGKED